MMSMKQLAGFQHAPNRTVKRLALTAIALTERCEELARKLREVEEQRASEQLAKEGRLLVVVDHHGSIEIKAESYQEVFIATMHDLGDPITSEDVARAKTPWRFKRLWDAKTIKVGAPAMDKYRLAWAEQELGVNLAFTELYRQVKAEQAVPQGSRDDAHGESAVAGAGAA